MIYLASPYSHPDPDVRHCRFRAVCKAAAVLIGQGNHVFSPIAHSHPISQFMEGEDSWDRWRAFDFRMIEQSEALFYLTIDGWKESVGVREEMIFATSLELPVEPYEPPEAAA